MRRMQLKVLALAPALIGLSLCSYLTEPPVKLLEVQSVATRFQAAASKYRLSITKGQDEPAKRTGVEKLNNFPANKMILHPGGCANYDIPVQSNQKYMIVQPARKPGKLYNDYCHKSKTLVTVKSSAQTTTFQCFSNPNDCSSASCIGNIEKTVQNKAQKVNIKVCNDQGSKYDAAIWELNLSSSNDTNKLKAVFGDDARLRLRNTANNPMSNTHLTLVTIVGNRGVGKSTISSLLSGNETMFKVGSSSTGTTTTGADISAVIPSIDYANTISQKLKEKISKPAKALPFFLIDSEGMNVRGKGFDFVTTAPPSVVGKVIIWVGAENVQTASILNNVGIYLDGLDQVILDGNDRGTSCKTTEFGHFAIVINKMMGTKSDDELYLELMTDEPDYIPGYDKRNTIRHKLRQCFSGLSVQGLPVLPVPSGKNVTYADLNKRYQDGLAKIVSTILGATLAPRTIPVGSISLTMNSTNAERIVATIIDEANKGELDLTGFDAFWTSTSTLVSIRLDKAKEQLKGSSKNCEAGGKVCSPCVCAYRNKAVQTTLSAINEIIANAKVQAKSQFKIDATKDAHQLMANLVNPWKELLTCTAKSKFNFQPKTTGICDSGITSSQTGTWNCQSAFICDNRDFPYTQLITINTKYIYIHDGASFNLLAPAKAANGKNGLAPGQSGLNGAAGIKGTGLKIQSNQFVQFSSKSLTVIARGGEGGNGGNGIAGAAGAPGVKGADGHNGAPGAVGARGADNAAIPTARDPKNAASVKALGRLISTSHSCSHHCWCHANCCTENNIYQAEWNDTVAGYPGGRGGNGGNGTPGNNGSPGKNGQAGGNGGSGGKGGEGGDIHISMKGLSINVQVIGGAGGQRGIGASGGAGGAGGPGGKGGSGGPAGAGGLGGNGRSQHKRWTMNWTRSQSAHCHLHCHCNGYGGFAAVSYAPHIDGPVVCCQGQRGPSGSPGSNMPNGAAGARGNPGANGVPGSNGAPGTSKSMVISG